VKRALRGVALLALVSGVAGCGSHSAATKLTIEAFDNSGTRVYRLECEPAGGTVRHPETMCGALRRQPDLRARGGYSHCGPGPHGVAESIRVTGSYRGTPVRSAFQGACPEGNDGFGAWSDLLYDAGPGSPQSQ
jgi:hypothetical protein